MALLAQMHLDPSVSCPFGGVCSVPALLVVLNAANGSLSGDLASPMVAFLNMGFTRHFWTLRQVIGIWGFLCRWTWQKDLTISNPKSHLNAWPASDFLKSFDTSLRQLWSSQSRWIGIGQHFDPEPQRVHSSLPQRDALAPLAFNAVMLGPCHALHKQKWPQEVLVTYIDDRTYTATTWQRAADLREAWREAVEIVGLRENGHKVKALCRGPKQRETAESVGFSPGQLVHTIRVLGLDFSKVNASPSGDARLAQAHGKSCPNLCPTCALQSQAATCAATRHAPSNLGLVVSSLV